MFPSFGTFRILPIVYLHLHQMNPGKHEGSWCCLSHPGFIWYRRVLAPCGSSLGWRLTGHTAGTSNHVYVPTDYPSGPSIASWVDTLHRRQKELVACLISISSHGPQNLCILSRKETPQGHQTEAKLPLVAGHEAQHLIYDKYTHLEQEIFWSLTTYFHTRREV